MNTASIVSKVWSFCTTLRDDGVGYGDYLEQLTYLIFLKMADEYARPPYGRDVGIPEGYGWASLTTRRGAELEAHYVALLRRLGQQKGMLGQIFTKARNKITDPAKLFRLIDMVDGTDWGDARRRREGRHLRGTAGAQRRGHEIRRGTVLHAPCPDPRNGGVRTPRTGQDHRRPRLWNGQILPRRPRLPERSAELALDRDQKAFLKHATFHGNEIVAGTRRLCLMNMLLHGIGEMTGETAVSPADALISPPSETFDYVLANPPFGKKSSMSFTNADGEQETDDLTYNRQDFWATTSNKQLNFVQHIRAMLKTTGRAAVVVPDNVLFEGGAGETIRRKLLQTTDLHTILRLPTGIFYAQGVKANVIFFDNRPASPDPQSSKVWYYDYRTNVHHTLKQKPLTYPHLEDFVACYKPENRHVREQTWSEETPNGRWRSYSRDELLLRDKASLDVFWLKDASMTDLENLPEPEVLADEIVANLQSALASFEAVVGD